MVRHWPLAHSFGAFEDAEPASRADAIDEYRELAMLADAWERGSLEPGVCEETPGPVADADGKELALR